MTMKLIEMPKTLELLYGHRFEFSHSTKHFTASINWLTVGFVFLFPFMSRDLSSRRTPWSAEEPQALSHLFRPHFFASCWCCSAGDHSWPCPSSQIGISIAHHKTGKTTTAEKSDLASQSFRKYLILTPLLQTPYAPRGSWFLHT